MAEALMRAHGSRYASRRSLFSIVEKISLYEPRVRVR